MARSPNFSRALVAILAVLGLQAVFVFTFVFPSSDLRPHDVPVGVAGPAPATAPVVQALQSRDGGEAFDARAYASAGAARDAIEEREIYGALVAGPEPRLLVASAASPQVAGLLENAFQAQAEARGSRLQVEDVTPLSAGDPRGIAFGLLLQPLVITSVIFALALFLLAPGLGGAARVASLAGFSALGGLVSVAIAGPMVGSLPGPFLGSVAVTALMILAISATTAGLIALIGPRGVGLGFLVFLLIGNVASGATTARELLPGFWRAVGPYLPPGAGADALRNVSYFGGSAILTPLLVLAAFALAGAAIVLVASRKRAPAAARSASGGLAASPA